LNLSPFYTNQIEIITAIARSLPVGYKLYVKEHYDMIIHKWRKISYYEALLALPNVKLIHPSVNPKEILKKSSLVISITGTTAFEALFYKKPSIVFTDLFFSELSSVYRIKSFEELPEAIRLSLKKDVDFKELKKYTNKAYENSFYFNNRQYWNACVNKFHNKGFMASDDISTSDLESFIEENRKMLELIVNEHIKKIQLHKENKSKSLQN